MPFEGHDFPQIIPVPEAVFPGGPPPWSRASDEARANVTVASVVDALAASGHTMEVQPADITEAAGDGPGGWRESAVLVALFDGESGCRVVLTRRASDLPSHQGQVAFPGGRCEPGESAVAAALREASEEVDLDPALVEPVGWLTPIVTYASMSSIRPIVGRLAAPPTLRASPREVARVFDVALADLMVEDNFLAQRWRRTSARPGADADGAFPMYFFKVPGEVVWGATARVLAELLALATGTHHADEWGRIA